jgi:hypothetical protein
MDRPVPFISRIRMGMRCFERLPQSSRSRPVGVGSGCHAPELLRGASDDAMGHV